MSALISLTAETQSAGSGPVGAGALVQMDLDGAWPADLLGEGTYQDVRAWGARLRYCATAEGMRQFGEAVADRLAPFTLFGSGDFHHLATVWLRQLREPFTLVSFDNHPDWDLRPPRWGCGSWVSRAAESPLLQRGVIWGCGNFELERPTSFFANHRALRSGRLMARPWAERLKPVTRSRWPVITPETWREDFLRFAETLAGQRVYVTVDLDCLRVGEAVTNWEQGLFTAADVAWAIRQIRGYGEVVGGDLCGAASEAVYARFRQRLSAVLDHPKLPATDPAEAARCNLAAWRQIWPALTGQEAAGERGSPRA